MSKLGDLLILAVLPAVQSVETDKLTELLDKFHDDNPELHKSTLQAGWAFIDNLQSVVDKTKTKIDNALVQGIEDAIVASAEKYGISLPS